MDTKQIEYILKIAEEKNITKAAEKLYITQSALNQQLLHLEKDLGAQLFIRTRNKCEPTEIGEVYIQAAQEMMHIKKQAYRKINDMLETKKGTLSIAFTADRGIDMFKNVYSQFHKLFPSIRVEPHELRMKDQLTEINNGRIDLGFGTIDTETYPNNQYRVLGKEEIFLIVPEGLVVEGAQVVEGAPYPVLELSAVKDQPFVLIYQRSTLRSIMDNLFAHAGYEPNVLFETRSNPAILDMAKAGECCGMIPAYYLKKYSDVGVQVFCLPKRPSWDIVVSYKKNTYLSESDKAFIRLAKEFWLK